MNDRVVAVALIAAFVMLPRNGHPAQKNAVPPTGITGPPSPGATCVLRGVTEPRANANIEDGQGRVIARFSGAATALVANDFPADARGRVRVETGTGAGGFRVRGFLPVNELPLFVANNVPVVLGHVWIAAGRSVSFVASAPGRLRIEKHLTMPFAQSFGTWAPCSSLALAASPPGGSMPTPKNARGYVMKRAALDVFDQPAGSALLTLNRASDAEGVLFFGTERRGDWVSLSHHGEVVIEAWARFKDLVQLPPGETMDQLTSRGSARTAAHLAVQGEPRVVKPLRPVTLRSVAKETEPAIGVVEPGAETYVLDIVAGWASVMPKALNVVPGPDGQFWVKASELGI